MDIRKEIASLIVVSVICVLSIPISNVYADDIKVPDGYVTEKITQEDIDNAIKEMNETSKANELVDEGYPNFETGEVPCANVKDWRNEYTLEEAYMVAAVVYAEAGHCSDEHQKYVASVILNRVEEDEFPSTIEGVIYQKHPIQYACAYNGHFDKALEAYRTDEWSDDLDRVWENTEEVLTEGSEIPSTVVFQAEFKQGSKVYKKLGNTYFCYR